MTASYFTPDGASPFSGVPRGGRIHIIGVCGVAMAQLALSLSGDGYIVSGSDRQFYDPMGSLLENSEVSIYRGYRKENVPDDVDLVVIANAMFYDNPEVRELERRRLPYTSFPQLIGEALIGDRHSIVVCGTHGKSTTTGIIASALYRAGRDPSYFIGGVSDDLPKSLHVGSGDLSVVEGDEYHSAFYARVPKFTFYRARTCVLNAVEFDHADLYPSVSDVVEEYRKLLLGLPEDGTALCCTDYPEIVDLLRGPGRDASARILTFGSGPGNDYRLVDRKQNAGSQEIRVVSPVSGEITVNVPLIGRYNAMNCLAAIAVLETVGLKSESIVELLAGAGSIQRRQQIRFDKGGVVFMEDFAHHPTAVRGTVTAVREAFPGRRLWAVFEPRSNTSRRKVFQEKYEKAFIEADKVILAIVDSESRMNVEAELMDIEELAASLRASGVDARALDYSQIESLILSGLHEGDVLLMMSNGSFNGLPGRIEDELEKRFAL